MSVLDILSGGRYAQADGNMADALRQFSDLRQPTIEELQVQYETLKS